MGTATLDQGGARELSASGAADCPHCHKPFVPSVDGSQPPRLQGAKCPHCKLFVPARALDSPT